MSWLIAGIVLWIALHLVPTMLRELRTRLLRVLGEPVYRLLFALGVLSAMALMVFGWRAAGPQSLYLPPVWGRAAAGGLMLVALILLVSLPMRSNLKRLIRYPQLAAVLLWALAHLLANGEQRSLILFAGLGLWALLEIPLIRRREGAWERPPRAPLTADLKVLLVGAAAYAVMLLLHPHLFGVPALLLARGGSWVG